MSTVMGQAALVLAIKAHIEKGDRAAEKSEQHYISAGQHLATLKNEHTVNWTDWEKLLKTKIGISTGRASELMQIADGRKTVEGVRAETAKRVAQHRESSSLRNEEKAEAANERDENEVPKRNNRSGAGRHQEVASPEVIERNLRHWISRHRAGAEAARKVVKVAHLEDEVRHEIGMLIERLIAKWRIVLSTLEAGRGKGPGGEGQARGTRALEECAGGGTRIREVETAAPPAILEKLRAAELKIIGLETEVEDLKRENARLSRENAEMRTRINGTNADGLDIPAPPAPPRAVNAVLNAKD